MGFRIKPLGRNIREDLSPELGSLEPAGFVVLEFWKETPSCDILK